MAEETPRKPVVEHWKSLANPIEADALRQESINARHDHLITEIETSDGPLATTLRSVYEGDELFKFEDRLNDRIKSHDKEIERMCNYHYQGFIDSVRELQLVSGDAAKLQGDIQGINADLQESCAPLTGKGEELIRCRRMQKNIAAAIENLSLCLPVLEMYGKLQDQMKSKRYYPALKTLEQLEHTYLPRVMSHWFSQTMAEAIPLLREKIKAASMMDLKDFLENIRKHLVRIGEVAMLHAAEQSNIDPAVAKRKRKRKVAPPPPNPFTGEVEMPPDLLQEIDDDDEERSAQDMVDFSPVYRCLHIYTVLGDKENFETYYRKQRWSQARLSLKPSPNMHESIDCYQQYFHDIVGSFVIEDHILSTTQGLVNRAFMDEMWEMAVVKIVAALKASIVKCTEADLLLKIKKLVVLFCHTLKGYGFTVGQLLEFLLIEMRDRYNSLLTEQWIDVFNEIFNEDNYTPIFIANEADYQSVITQFPFKSKELERAPFPKKFPYSQFVPNIYNQVKEFINACLKFSADLHLSNTEIDDMIRKSANLFLTETLSDCLSSLMKRPNLSLLQLTQIVINMNYLEKSCGYLEEHISTITGAETDSVHATRLQGISMFKGAQNDAEEHIYELLNEKIDEFLDLASYNWSMTDLKGHASDFIIDLIAFLRDTFAAFEHLPQKLAQTACMSACKHIAVSLMNFLLDNDVRQMTLISIEQFEFDLIQCEQFASSEPVPGYNDGTLLLAFADLRQLLDLFLNEDWSLYLSDYGKPKSKYIRVKPAVAITLLEKLNNYDKKKGLRFASLKKNEREKRKLLETVLKQLKGLANENYQHTTQIG